MEAEVGGENVEDGEKEGKFWGGGYVNMEVTKKFHSRSTEQRKARSQKR